MSEVLEQEEVIEEAVVDQVEETTAAPDILAMSDEDLANFDPSTLADFTEEAAPAIDTEEAEEAEVVEDAEDAADEEGEPAEAKPKAKAEPAEEEAATIAPNFEQEYKKILAPFKANGKDMQVANAEDAIALMQMGANYNKKMAGLKPNLKLMKLLENNGLLDEAKLSFLIDLDKKDPDAISKLLKDSGLDPLDIDVNAESEYKPKTYAVDDREMELDAVLEEIQSTPTYAQTIGVVSNKWDGPSKQVVVNNPQLLKVINDHFASGIYEIINKEVESERMFGRLSGVSDIEAYRVTGDAIEARGGFAHLNKQPAPAKTVVTPRAKVEDPALNDKKRAASSPKAAVSPKVGTEFNPLSLSDEEFSKQYNSRFL